ncbi:hypothetical protein CBR_g31155 [Chara braunii]|uniref:DUF1664 domain-containing protein n=1 Tax=Chara braunii TaxID=69332 RepID=A0A388LEG9_CHABU|nr:hypothetical protein CBR_g31155 [Chara braunii]|eukprot:GBG80698.1 hypothetical protein CBR_g31155 [Chara braunii]
MAGSKLIILALGAGVTGSMIMNGGTSISEIVADIVKVLMKHLREKGEINVEVGGQVQDQLTAQLTQQVRRLTQEMRQLAAATSRNVTVVHASHGAAGSLLSYSVPLAVIGAGTYAYLRWKGFCFGDLMYVTKRSMSNAVSSFTKQLESVTAALQATKRQLTAKLEDVNKTLDESMEVQCIIKEQVMEVRSDLDRFGREIESVHQLVEGLELKLDEVTGKQDFANKGIVFLCSFVSQGLEGGNYRPETIQSVKNVSQARLERSTRSTPQLTGRQGLQVLTEFLVKELPPSKGTAQSSPLRIAGPPERSISDKIISDNKD